jgi:hypothetical protein
MSEKLLEVGRVAKRLSLHPATIRMMFKNGVLLGIRTGPSSGRIRIFESSLNQHIESKKTQNEQLNARGIL